MLPVHQTSTVAIWENLCQATEVLKAGCSLVQMHVRAINLTVSRGRKLQGKTAGHLKDETTLWSTLPQNAGTDPKVNKFKKGGGGRGGGLVRVGGRSGIKKKSTVRKASQEATSQTLRKVKLPCSLLKSIFQKELKAVLRFVVIYKPYSCRKLYKYPK